jgi:proteasome lid subunit RPN8/RPN11
MQNSQPILHISKTHWEQMRADVDQQAPEEACGFVAGKRGVTRKVIPVTNALHSPVRFRMEPSQQLEGMLEIDRQDWDMAAIYHSHPHGPPHPSPTDLAEAAYPNVIHLIWFKEDSHWRCRGFIIYEGEYWEIPLRLED